MIFYQYLEYDPLNIWLNIGIFGRIKIGLVFGLYGCHFIGIGLVSVWFRFAIFLKMASLVLIHDSRPRDSSNTRLVLIHD